MRRCTSSASLQHFVPLSRGKKGIKGRYQQNKAIDISLTMNTVQYPLYCYDFVHTILRTLFGDRRREGGGGGGVSKSLVCQHPVTSAGHVGERRKTTTTTTTKKKKSPKKKLQQQKQQQQTNTGLYIQTSERERSMITSMHHR